MVVVVVVTVTTFWVNSNPSRSSIIARRSPIDRAWKHDDTSSGFCWCSILCVSICLLLEPELDPKKPCAFFFFFQWQPPLFCEWILTSSVSLLASRKKQTFGGHLEVGICLFKSCCVESPCFLKSVGWIKMIHASGVYEFINFRIYLKAIHYSWIIWCHFTTSYFMIILHPHMAKL